MFRIRCRTGWGGGGRGGGVRRGAGGGSVVGQMRALKRGARTLGRSLRRQSARSLRLCCVVGHGGAYERLTRSPPVESEQLCIDNLTRQDWPVWASLGLSSVVDSENTVVVKIGMVGDCQTGKTSFMVNYVSSLNNQDYTQTVGVASMEKIFRIQNVNIAFNIWDLGGHRQFASMMPIVCQDADAILLMFDLTRRSTLHSLKQWYVEARQCNKAALVVMIGTKFDHFVTLPEDTQRAITRQARLYSQTMGAALFFSSVTHNINVQKIFKVIAAKVFDLPCNITRNLTIGEPIIDY